MSPLESSFSHPPPSSPTVPRVFRDKWEGSDLDTWAREVNGIKVVRRAGEATNNSLGALPELMTEPTDGLVNGTKLLNCTNMTRGRRDGILKNERSRTVIKVGSHALKGVWYGVMFSIP